MQTTQVATRFRSPVLLDMSLPSSLLLAPARTPAVFNPRDLVGGLEKGLAVISAFDLDKPRLTITEVANRAGLSRAAARRYLLTLTQIGYAHHDGRCFSLTPRVLRLGQSYLHSARLPRMIQPRLNQLVAHTGDASAAGVLDGDDVLSIAACGGGLPPSARLQPATRVPAYCSANGRVLMAFRPESEWGPWIERQRLLPRTSQTITDPGQLLRELERTRQQGYALVDQELDIDLRTLAVPLHNNRGQLVAAVNLGASAARRSLDDLVARGLPLLRQAQRELRALL